MENVRWGLLSTANINRRLIPAIRASKRGELIAVASRSYRRSATSGKCCAPYFYGISWSPVPIGAIGFASHAVFAPEILPAVHAGFQNRRYILAPRVSGTTETEGLPVRLALDTSPSARRWRCSQRRRSPVLTDRRTLPAAFESEIRKREIQERRGFFAENLWVVQIRKVPIPCPRPHGS